MRIIVLLAAVLSAASAFELADTAVHRFPAAGIDTLEVSVRQGGILLELAGDTLVTVTIATHVVADDEAEAVAALEKKPPRVAMKDRLLDIHCPGASPAGSSFVHVALPAGIVPRFVVAAGWTRCDRIQGSFLLDYIRGDLFAGGTSGSFGLRTENDNSFHCYIDSIGAGDTLLIDGFVGGVRVVLDPHILARVEARSRGGIEQQGFRYETDPSPENTWHALAGTGNAGWGRGCIRVTSPLDAIRFYGKP